VREEHVDKTPILTEDRITPACAGRTRTVLTSDITAEDHPRVCGKNGEFNPGDKQCRGSPPRVREERSLTSTVLRFLRDHPRVCGKNLLEKQRKLG